MPTLCLIIKTLKKTNIPLMTLWSQINSVFMWSSESVWLKGLFKVSICAAL